MAVTAVAADHTEVAATVASGWFVFCDAFPAVLTAAVMPVVVHMVVALSTVAEDHTAAISHTGQPAAEYAASFA